MNELPNNVNGQQLLTWLTCAFILVMFANQCIKFYRNWTGGETVPQPLQVKQATDFLPKDQFDNFAAAHSRELAGIHSKIGGVERGTAAEIKAVREQIHEMELRILTAGEERSTKIHERINIVLQNVSELKGKVEA